jgi:ABC-type nitrate/sulfonate/bicarbonate transport systems, periplasmic components
MKVLRITSMMLSLLLLLSSCGRKSGQNKTGSESREIKIGFMPGSSPVIIAKAKGWFDQEFTAKGIKVTFYQCSYGPPMVEAFISEKIDVGLMGDQPAIVGYAQGVKFKAVASFATGYKNDGLLVAPGSGIHSIKDLKGKKIAVPVGSLLQHLLHLYLPPFDHPMLPTGNRIGQWW